ncbi:uncharacterized protein MCYG_07391 [Microsporum canis CBS 113480]|uniref:Uncharacterized protein n=1 Tax=Arthroderma otae (strain ATCC MYA-4605 / CBS 113480) TaxID=554155 RepID=C5FYH4_ARTOC|nr:uncharacterized protein MCYG_07391 [Microsporum canis CBS 113480]EEQ34572.1 predicted protein [Microsporum canis CBS 113480]
MTRSLSYETGGILPDRIFSRFRYDKPLSPEAFKAAHKIIDRWSDVHELDKEFSFLKVKYYLSNGICLSASEEVNGDWKYMYDTEKHASKTAEEIKNPLDIITLQVDPKEQEDKVVIT